MWTPQQEFIKQVNKEANAEWAKEKEMDIPKVEVSVKEWTKAGIWGLIKSIMP